MPHLPKLAVLLALLVALDGCAGTPAPTLVPQPVYPNLPNLVAPPGPVLTPLHFDYPRLMQAAPVVRQQTNCEQTPPAQRNALFWTHCGEQPVDPHSNLYVGLSQGEFIKYKANEQRLSQWAAQMRQRVQEVNAERAQWRAKNQAH